MDDTVAAVGVGELRGDPLDGVDHLLQCRITDAVGRQMVAVGIGKLGQLVQLLVGEQQQALGVRVVVIRLAHGGGMGAQRAVAQKLHRAELEVTHGVVGPIAQIQEPLQLVRAAEADLLVDTDGQPPPSSLSSRYACRTSSKSSSAMRLKSSVWTCTIPLEAASRQVDSRMSLISSTV